MMFFTSTLEYNQLKAKKVLAINNVYEIYAVYALFWVLQSLRALGCLKWQLVINSVRAKIKKIVKIVFHDFVCCQRRRRN